MKFDFAKELHFRELDRRVRLDSGTTLRVAAISMLVALLIFCGKVYLGSHGIGALILLTLVILASLCVLFAAYQILRCYVGFHWRYLRDPAELLGSYNALLEYHAKNGLSKGPDTEFEDQLRDRLVEAASFNQVQNNRRAEYLDLASRSIAAGFLFAALACATVIFVLIRIPANI